MKQLKNDMHRDTSGKYIMLTLDEYKQLKESNDNLKKSIHNIRNIMQEIMFVLETDQLNSKEIILSKIDKINQ